MTVVARVSFVCTECRRRMVGSPGDEARRSCYICGGQLKAIKWGPRQRRAHK